MRGTCYVTLFCFSHTYVLSASLICISKYYTRIVSFTKDNTDYYMGVCGVFSSYETGSIGRHSLFSSIREVLKIKKT